MYQCKIKFSTTSWSRINFSELPCSVGNISILSLADNGLSKLKPISRLLGLVTLNLSNNKIEDFDEVEYLDRLPMLQEVDLSFNPICSEADYRSQVLGRFPNRIHDLMVSFKISSI